MNILLVFCHPRRDSFTGAVADAFATAAQKGGHTIEWADLYREEFDPVLREPDEPDWNDTDKTYSAEVQIEMARIERNNAIVFIAPIWWWSVPAMLKGWIDRVWNLNFAYGGSKLAIEKGLLIGTCASGAHGFRERSTDAAIEAQLGGGTMGYCGIDRHSVTLLHDVLDSTENRQSLLEQASRLGEGF
ncbi:MAG: NAD(P)H oxidoreductase [Pseudomonadota bacterium]